jgi:malonate transporter and related proteins
MAVVIAALLPVFILIVLGVVLRHSLMRLDTQWHGLERLTYFVLFPMLLIQTLVKADLSKVPVAGVGGALLLSALVMSLLCLALRPALARLDIDGPAFSSIFQGATRWQTYVALSVCANMFGDVGLALASVAMVAIIPLVNVFSVAVLAHYASPEKQSARAIVMTVIRNPLIWACAIGLVINLIHLPLPKIWHEVADALGRSSLAIGLLVTGAGLQLKGSRWRSPRGSGSPATASSSSRSARRCRPHPAPMCWPARWAATRRCWRRSSRCRRCSPRSRCRLRSRWCDRAFSSEVDTGSRQENASKQESRAPFRFNRNGNGASVSFPATSSAQPPSCCSTHAG